VRAAELFKILQPCERAQVIKLQLADVQSPQLCESLLKEREILDESKSRDVKLFKIKALAEGREVLNALIVSDVQSLELLAFREILLLPVRKKKLFQQRH
jgi:hypothetical protein